MNIPLSVNQTELLDVLLNVAVIRPVFIWGAPGIGKSSIVENFAQSLGLACVSLLGSQLAPEDIIGVPQIIDGKKAIKDGRMPQKIEIRYIFSLKVLKRGLLRNCLPIKTTWPAPRRIWRSGRNH